MNDFLKLLKKHLKESDKSELVLSENNKKTLLQIARNTLKTFLTSREIPEVICDEPVFLEPAATFVTLRTKSSGSLRGCKGEIFPSRPLSEAVQNTAISSATNDPRFPEVRSEELCDLHIEISVLKALKPINTEQVVVGKHGLIITKGSKVGLLLPHVPVLYNFDKQTFLKELCHKAGLKENALEDEDAYLYGFEAEVFEES